MSNNSSEILKILKQEKKPLTASQILANTSVNKTTVYRNLYKLVAESKVREVFIKPEIVHYELGETKHHHHLVCKSCGDISEVDSVKIEKTIDELSLTVKEKFVIKEHHLEFYGICVNCL